MKFKTTLPSLLLLLFISVLGFAQERIAVIQEPLVILIDPADGSIVDPNFIDLTPLGTATPKGLLQVDDEIWITDQIEDRIDRFALDGTFISAIDTGLDNVKGLEVVDDEVWVTNAGSNNGAPGDALVRFDFDGVNLGFYSTTGSSFDITDIGGEVYISYIGVDTRIERRDYDGNILGTIVGTGVVTFLQQIEQSTANNSVYAGVFSSNGANTPGLYEFAEADGAILNYYDVGALRGVAILDDGNVLYSTGNNINLLNTTTNSSSLVSSGGASQYFNRVNLMPCTIPATPTGDATQTFNEGATLADIVVNPTNVTWFATEIDASTNTNPLPNTTVLVDGEDYFAISINGSCLSDSLEVTVTIICNPPATPTGDAAQTVAPGSTLADLVVDPITVTWYATEADALANINALPLTTILVDQEDYFAVNIVNDCASDPFEVTVTLEVLGVSDFNLNGVNVYPNPVTSELTIESKDNIVSIAVHNMLGQLVLETDVENTITSVQMTGFRTGIYLVTVKTANAQETIKVVKR